MMTAAMEMGGPGNGALNPYAPPAAAIDAVAPAALAGGVYTFKSTIGLAKAIAVAMAANAAAELAGGVNAVLTIGVMHRWVAPPALITSQQVLRLDL